MHSFEVLVLALQQATIGTAYFEMCLWEIKVRPSPSGTSGVELFVRTRRGEVADIVKRDLSS